MVSAQFLVVLFRSLLSGNSVFLLKRLLPGFRFNIHQWGILGTDPIFPFLSFTFFIISYVNPAQQHRIWVRSPDANTAPTDPPTPRRLCAYRHN